MTMSDHLDLGRPIDHSFGRFQVGICTLVHTPRILDLKKIEIGRCAADFFRFPIQPPVEC